MLALLAGIVVALAIGLSQGGGEVEQPDAVPTAEQAKRDVAQAPPPLKRLYARGGELVQLSGDGFVEYIARLRGYPVVINKWAEWCGPCREEFPILRKAAARHGTRVAFIGLNSGDKRDRAEAFLRTQPTVYPNVRDPDEQIARALQAATVSPSTIFLDTKGNIVTVRQGVYSSLAQLERDLRQYAGLDGRAAPDVVGLEKPGAAR